MDERAIKKLLITLAVAIAIIMMAKFMLTRTVTRLNQAAELKKQAAIKQPPAAPTPEIPADTQPAQLASPATETIAASAVEGSTQ